MFIPRHETEVLQEKLNQAIENGIGTTILISGEPGIGKTTLIKNFMDNCDNTSEKNVLTAVGSCLDMDGVSRGFLPWREVLIELDADKAAGKDEEKKSNFKKIVKTVFDEAGSQWLEAIPVIGDISSAIFETAKTISKDELIDTETGDSKKLALKDRLKNVAKECTGEWLNVIPVVGNLSAAIYKTTSAIQKSKQVTYSQNQEDFFIRVMSRFRELAETNPVVIYIDDLQWADISSMNLFFYLAKNLKDSPFPMVLIGSFRPQDVKDGRLNPISGEMERHPWEEKINNLKRYDAAEFLEVTYLKQNQVDSYIDLNFPNNAFSQNFKNEITNLTKGNSLFVRELLLNLEERKIIFKENGKYLSKETIDISNLPTTVIGIIEERFQRLNEDLQEVLQIASVQGSDFSLELIGAILEENSFKMSKKINALQQKYSLILKSEVVYDKLKKIYNFVHNLVQKYIYHQMTNDFRIELHSVLIETLEEFFKGDEINKVAEQYSYHFGIANGIINEERKLLLSQEEPVDEDVIKKYIELQEILAEGLKSSFQNEEAIKKYSELSNIYQTISMKEKEIETKIIVANLNSFIGKMEVTNSILKTCFDEAQKHNLQELLGDSCFELGKILANQEVNELGKEYLQKALNIYTEIQDKKKLSKVFLSLGDFYDVKSDYSKAMEWFEKALKISEKIGDKKGISYAMGYIGSVHREKGDLDKANEYFQKKLTLSEEIGDKIGLSKALGNIGIVFAIRADYENAKKYFEREFELAKEIGSLRNISSSLSSLGLVNKNLGDLDKALEYFEENLKHSKKLGDKHNILISLGNLGSLFHSKGNLEKALEFLKESLKLCEEIGDKKGTAISYGKIGNVYKDQENYEKALEAVEKTIEIAKEIGIKIVYMQSMQDKAELLMKLERYEEAKVLNSKILELDPEKNFPYLYIENNIISAKIDFALGDKENPPKRLLKILIETEDNEEIATINYELWKMTSDENYKLEALKIYQCFFSSSTNLVIKKRIKELEN